MANEEAAEQRRVPPGIMTRAGYVADVMEYFRDCGYDQKFSKEIAELAAQEVWDKAETL